MYTISKEFHFSASHQLRNLPDTHQCARLHGHNYILTVRLTGSMLDKVGFVVDYGELSFVKHLVDKLDHRHLNDIFEFNPTSENICKAFFNAISEEFKLYDDKFSNVDILGVGLSETPKTTAWYERWM